VNIEELYRRYAQDVYRFACWLCGDRTEAEDIVSETFLRAWTGNTHLEVSTVKAYLLVIARHVFLKRQRRAKRHAELGVDLADGAAGPDRRAEGRDELTAAMKALQTLPEAERAALLLRAQQGLPYEEIARSLDISIVAAKVRVHRARIRLGAHQDCREAAL
jgi:RNA polymerase sigma-70 factor, ECF subfamily